MNLVTARPYCSEIAFYNDFLPKSLTYRILYQSDAVSNNFDSDSLKLSIIWDEENKLYKVTIPRKEQ
jgi:hypothetical protein